MTYKQNLKAILDTFLPQIKDEIKDSIIDSMLRLEPRDEWTPVSDPLNELPKDKHLLVTVKEEGYRGYVNELYYDMTEWSDFDEAKNAIAYKYYPEPYKEVNNAGSN